MPFFTSGLFQKVIKNVKRNAETCRFFWSNVFYQAFLWYGTWWAKLYRILDREILNMTIWFEGSFCVAGHLSKPLKCLKMVKLWLWSSAKDHTGRKKVRGSRWWCLFRPSWPRNWFISKKWWHPKIPIVNSGAKLLKNLKNRFLSFFPTDFLHLWTKTPTKHHSN